MKVLANHLAGYWKLQVGLKMYIIWIVLYHHMIHCAKYKKMK